MNSSVFLNKENINTLWDLISDLNIFKFLSKNIQNKIYTIFTNNIQNFFETEKTLGNELAQKYLYPKIKKEFN